LPEHADWDALAVGWALSTLEPHDEARFAVHLPGCDGCTQTVRDALRTVADLAYAMPDEAPPPALKARIMSAAAVEPRGRLSRGGTGTVDVTDGEPAGEGEWPLGNRLGGAEPLADWFAQPGRDDRRESDGSVAGPAPGATDQGPGDPLGRTGEADNPVHGPEVGDDVGDEAAERIRPGAGGRHAARDDGDGLAPVVPLEPRRRNWLGRAAAAAAVVLVAALGIWNVQLRSEQDDLRRIVAQREAAIQELTADGPARIAAVTEDGKPGTRYATVVVKEGRLEVITETLAPTSGEVTYWLWRLTGPTDAQPVPIEGFRVPSSRFGVNTLRLSGSDLVRVPLFAVSKEPSPRRPDKPTDIVGVGAATG
jgi:hypothetical protein